MKTIFRLLLCIGVFSGSVFGQGAAAPFMKPQYLTNSFSPCAACNLYTYAAGTTTPQATYQDYLLVTPNANPIVLDSLGRPPAGIYLSANSYKFVLQTSAGATVWTQDNIYEYGQLYAGGASISARFAHVGIGAAADGTYQLNLGGTLVNGNGTGVGIGVQVPTHALDINGAVGITATNPLVWNSDAGISRLAAASLAMGNGTQGDATAIVRMNRLGLNQAVDATASIAATQTALGIISTDGGIFQNTTAAALGAQQWSPRWRWRGYGWSTTNSNSQPVDFIIENETIQGAASPTGNLVIQSQVNGGGYANPFSFSTGGLFTTQAATVSGLTANSFLYSGSGGALTTTSAPANGQLLIGSTGAAPVAASLTAGANITITPGAGSITIASSTGIGGGGTTGQMTYWSGPSTITGSSALLFGGNGVGFNTTAPSTNGVINGVVSAIGTTPADGIFWSNTTVAAAGAQQYSPAGHLEGQGWKTASTAASQPVDFRWYVIPVQGPSNPTGYFHWESAVNGGSYSGGLNLFTSGGLSLGQTTDPGAGNVNAQTGFQVNNAAPTGTILRGDGTKFLATTATYPNTTTSNQVLWSSAGNTVTGLTSPLFGTGVIYPSSDSGTAIKITKADASTALLTFDSSTPQTTLSTKLIAPNLSNIASDNYVCIKSATTFEIVYGSQACGSSDERIKNILGAYTDDALSFVLSAAPIRYTFKSGYGDNNPNVGVTPREQLGFSAQKMYPMVPDLVAIDTSAGTLPGGTYSFDYVKWGAVVLTKALQQEDAKVESEKASRQSDVAVLNNWKACILAHPSTFSTMCP